MVPTRPGQPVRFKRPKLLIKDISDGRDPVNSGKSDKSSISNVERCHMSRRIVPERLLLPRNILVSFAINIDSLGSDPASLLL